MFVFYFSRKILSAILIRGIIDHLYRNNTFLELKQTYVSNSTTYSTNFTVKLLYSEVHGAEWKKWAEQFQTPPKKHIFSTNMFFFKKWYQYTKKETTNQMMAIFFKHALMLLSLMRTYSGMNSVATTTDWQMVESGHGDRVPVCRIMLAMATHQQPWRGGHPRQSHRHCRTGTSGRAAIHQCLSWDAWAPLPSIQWYPSVTSFF
jgi:hypothetical protein